jgi:hypothetical protein
MGVQRRPNPDLKIQTSGRLRSDARPPLFFFVSQDSPEWVCELTDGESGASSERDGRFVRAKKKGSKKASQKPCRAAQIAYLRPSL